MSVQIAPTFDNARVYLREAKKNGADIPRLWERYMIEPYWADIARWAPFDQSFKKPLPVTNLQALEMQLSLFTKLSLDGLYDSFNKVAESLPAADGTMLVVLYPHDNGDRAFKERENGVRGTSVFGNMILSVNPLAEQYRDWLPYVFAHEYHHNIWGYHQYTLHQGKKLDGSLLESMVTEGQADAFAESLFPHLLPEWNRPFACDTETLLWDRLKPALLNTDRATHDKFIFGCEEEGLPWCMGYSFGRSIVNDYMKKHPCISFLDLLEVPAREMIQDYHLEA